MFDAGFDVVDREHVIHELRMLVVYPSRQREVIPFECLTDLVEPQGLVKVTLNGLPFEVSLGLGL